MRCFVVAGFLLTSASRVLSAIAEFLVQSTSNTDTSPIPQESESGFEVSPSQTRYRVWHDGRTASRETVAEPSSLVGINNGLNASPQ